MPHPDFSPRKEPTVKEAGWATGLFWKGTEKRESLVPTVGVRTPGLPGGSELPYQLYLINHLLSTY